MTADTRVIVALDYSDAARADAFIARLDAGACCLKVGKELFTSAGPRWVETLVARGFPVFLDLKYHDIPHTVAQACKAAAQLGVWMVNVHALGGRRMLEAAREALETVNNRPLLIAVTILTSHSEADLAELGLIGSAEEWVLRLAKATKAAGLDGVVCSAREAALLKAECGAAFRLVTPGIRPAGASQDDQSRIVTPADALKNGSDHLVIGRPITQAADPMAALAAIRAELDGALVK